MRVRLILWLQLITFSWCICNIDLILRMMTISLNSIKRNSEYTQELQNKDELKKISDPIEREYFEATHRIDPKDFLRLGEVELTYKDGVYRSRKGNYSSSDYYNEFFQEDRIPDVSKAYVIALKWVFNTYFLSHQNDWVYPYTRAPLMKDISEILFNPNDDFGIPNINLHFTPIQQLFYIIPIPKLVTLIPMPYRNEITPEILQKFQTELEKHVNDLMDLRGVTYANKGFSNFVFPLSDKEIKSMFPTYPKHGYDFDSPDVYVLRNQCFNLACYANILGTFLKGNDSDETIRRKITCLKRKCFRYYRDTEENAFSGIFRIKSLCHKQNVSKKNFSPRVRKDN